MERDKMIEANFKENNHPSMDDLIPHESKLLMERGAVKSKPISSNCVSEFHAVHNSGTRQISEIDLIVMHDTEGGTARSVASYFTTPQSGGSTQLVVDDNECQRCLQNNEIPWGAPGANTNGFHIEQCGYASWGSVMWSKTHRRTLMRAAYKAAYHCRLFKLKPVFRTSANLKAGIRHGITTHAECTKAYGGSHVDPGTGWPRALFMTMVKAYYLSMIRVKPLV